MKKTRAERILRGMNLHLNDKASILVCNWDGDTYVAQHEEVLITGVGEDVVIVKIGRGPEFLVSPDDLFASGHDGDGMIVATEITHNAITLNTYGSKSRERSER